MTRDCLIHLSKSANADRTLKPLTCIVMFRPALARAAGLCRVVTGSDVLVACSALSACCHCCGVFLSLPAPSEAQVMCAWGFGVTTKGGVSCTASCSGR